MKDQRRIGRVDSRQLNGPHGKITEMPMNFEGAPFDKSRRWEIRTARKCSITRVSIEAHVTRKTVAKFEKGLDEKMYPGALAKLRLWYGC